MAGFAVKPSYVHSDVLTLNLLEYEMTFASEIENRLHRFGLKVIAKHELYYCYQFRLVCGAIIIAY